MKHMYCEKCRHLFEGEHCPNCRKSRVRPVKPEDPCFLTEKGFFTESCGIDRNEVDKRSKEDF